MEEVMSGQVTPAQLGALLAGLRVRGESVDEIVGFAQVMRSKVTPVPLANAGGSTSPTESRLSTSGRSSLRLVDTCGTGGDAAGTFNISTAAAFVAAGAGVKVAKHGNRAMTSQCGSADVLEALGVKISLSPEGVAQCIQNVGMGFMFAPNFHPAMKFAAGPRREIGFRTVFNILGPLTNPAGARAQVVGVPEEKLLTKLAWALQQLGSEHSLVVRGEDGLDEITSCAETKVCEQRGKVIKSYVITPESMGIKRARPEELRGGTPQENAEMIRALLKGEKGSRRDVVMLNAAAAITVAGRANDLREGVELAQRSIDSGEAYRKLEQLIEVSSSLT
jgi:anthranilate phosphoribosyltransferase